jgi:hypothetical protein
MARHLPEEHRQAVPGLAPRPHRADCKDHLRWRAQPPKEVLQRADEPALPDCHILQTDKRPFPVYRCDTFQPPAERQAGLGNFVAHYSSRKYATDPNAKYVRSAVTGQVTSPERIR